jgi:hypothetical protein
MKSSGQIELFKAEKAVKTSFKILESIKDEDLQDIKEILMDKDKANVK